MWRNLMTDGDENQTSNGPGTPGEQEPSAPSNPDSNPPSPSPQGQPGWQAPQPGWQTPPGWQAQPGWQPGPFWPPAVPPAVPPASPGIPQAGLPYLPAWQSEGSSLHRQPSKLPQILMVVAVALLAFSAGMVTDSLVFGGEQFGGQPSATNAGQEGPLDGFALYSEALNIVRTRFVGKSDLTDKQLLYGSISGMVDSLGDAGHTSFMTPEEYAAATSSLSGSFGGIGVVGTDTNGVPAIERVLPGTPADKSGLKAGDQIMAVDGTSTSGKTFADLVPELRGKVGTKVTLTILHVGSTTPVDVVVTRAEIKIPLVDWGMVPGTKIADIVLYEFSAGASDQLETAISEATDQGATAIVLDLRGNPGGYIYEAQGVAGNFLESGVLYIQEDANGKRTSVNIDASKTETKLPTVVLVDRATASAAEIVTGALQDSDRATVIGINTVGTGTVLQVFGLSDGSAIALATAEYLTPDGNRIFGKGIKPDQIVALPIGAAPTDPNALATMTPTQFAASTDAELLAAVKALGQ
jgi:carboxyl-terminal processing protease